MSGLLRLWQSTIGKKVVMAGTGVILLGFVVGHMLGNLQIFINDGGKAINQYALFLHTNVGLLWGTRAVLLVCVLLHIVTAIQLRARNRAARPVPYVVRDYRDASYASRTMFWSGLIIAAFVIYHLLHLTAGKAHPGLFRMQADHAGVADVRHNVIAGFGMWYIAFFYIVAQLLLGMHLSHGAWSMLQSVGINHPAYTPWLKLGARGLAAVITLGNVSIAVACFAAPWLPFLAHLRLA